MCVCRQVIQHFQKVVKATSAVTVTDSPLPLDVHPEGNVNLSSTDCTLHNLPCSGLYVKRLTRRRDWQRLGPNLEYSASRSR